MARLSSVQDKSHLAPASLAGKRVALPETRQLHILSQLLQARGALVRPVPLVAIHDAPDPAPVLAWVKDFIDRVPDDLILLTGEGLRRLLALAQREGLQDAFVQALSQTRKWSRGPKPGRALREIGLATDIEALAPTSEGMIQTLAAHSLAGRRIGVQLYGSEPNHKLVDYIRAQGAEPLTVAPYVYADKAEEAAVVELIGDLAEGRLDVMVFTSQPQFHRLQQVARRHQLEDALTQGLAKVMVAAVGPVVQAQLQEAGVAVTVVPARSYFMKPLVLAIARHFQEESSSAAESK